MKQHLFFALGTVIAYPVGILLVYIISAALPTPANDAPGQGMEIGFRFILLAVIATILVCVGSFILSKHLFGTTQPALIVSGGILLLTLLVARFM